MKSHLLAVLCLVFLAGQAIAEEATLKSEKEKVSYSIGMDIGANMKKQSIDIDTEMLIQGIRDALSGGKMLMTEEEKNQTLTAFRSQMMAKQQEQFKASAEKNKKEGEAFLAENKKKEGVKTTPSGLQYRIVKEGTGKTPKETDTVTVNYKGTLISGSEFDSSYKRGQPATFPVNGVIKGWTEALKMMKEGSKWELFIPSELAYGERGAGTTIGPNSVLIFEVELISIK